MSFNNKIIDRQNDITVSVIIPVYNVQDYLDQCVQSVLRQYFSDFEVILVDDGSTDNSGQLCDNYAALDCRITVIHKKNGGLSDARNRGLELASGKYIIFLDSDDFWEKDSLHRIVEEILETDMEVCFLSRARYTFGAKKLNFKGYEPKCFNGKSYIEILKQLSIEDRLHASACTKIIRRDFLLKNDIRFKKGIFSEDIDFFFNILLHAKKYIVLSYPFYIYRAKRDGSITNTISEKNIYDLVKIILKWIKKVEDNNINDEVAIFYYRMFGYLFEVILALIGYLNKEVRKKWLERLKKISWVHRYRVNMRSRCIQLLLKITGINITSRLLYLYFRLRG